MGAKLVVVVVVVVVVVMAVPGGVLELPIDETPEEQVEVERTLFMDGTGDAQADESFICFSKTWMLLGAGWFVPDDADNVDVDDADEQDDDDDGKQILWWW